MELRLLEKERELESLRETVRSQSDKESKRGGKRRSRKGGERTFATGDDFDEGEDDLEDSDESEETDEDEGYEDETLGMYAETAGRKLDLGNAEALREMRALHLSGQGVNDPMLAQLGKTLVQLPMLRVLDLSSNSLADSCAGLIAQMLSQRGVGLEELSLRDNRFHLAGAQTMGRALLRNESLQSLDISENPFADDGNAGKVLGEIFGDAKNALTRLVISIRDPRHDRASMTKRGSAASFVTHILSAHCRITSLGMVQRSLPKAALVCLASEGLSKAYLRVLDLSMAFIGSQGAVIVAKAMMRAQKSLCGTDVKTSSFQSKLREASRESFHLLEELVLRMNAIGALGAAWLAKAIAASFTIKRVNLAANELTDASAGHLAKALLETEAPLEELNLARNKIFRADLETTQKGAAALCEAVRSTASLRSLGPAEHLLFSVSMKRRLLEALAHRSHGGASAFPEADAQTQSGTLEIFAQPERARLAQLTTSPTQASVDICAFTLPPGLGEILQINIAWETDPPFEWRVIRERREHAFGDPSADVMSAGDAHTQGRLVAMKARGDTQRTWMRYEVETSDWRSGDRLVVEVRPEPLAEGFTWKGTHVQKVVVRAVVENASKSFTAIGHPAADTEEKAHDDNGRTVVLQDRSWDLETAVLVDGRNAANAFQRIHDFYVHAGTRGGELQLAWDMRIERVGAGVPLRNRRAPNGGILGVQWRITKNGTASTALLGDEDSSRVLAVQGQDLDYAHYRVSLRTLDTFVGDTLTLWVRLPAHVLHRVRSRQVFTLRSTHARLLHVRGSTDHELFDDDDENEEPINLAGADPFRLDMRAAHLWA